MVERSPKEVVQFAKDSDVQMVDIRFIDLPGTWHHFSLPVDNLTEALFEEGLGFDGSSIRGFQAIHESDMLLLPDPNTAFIDPFFAVPTLDILCDVHDPLTLQEYSRSPRYIAKKAEAYLKSTGVADDSYWGPEAEFFVFSDVRYGQTPNSSYYFVDSPEAIWNSGEDEGPNLGYKVRHKEGYFPVPPTDQLQDMRTEMILTLAKCGVRCEVHHHEVATAGQCELDLYRGGLLETADNLMIYKYVIKNVARKHGMTATFMPKPLYGDNGSGMHCHQSLWKGGKPLFYDENGYALLSRDAMWYIGGLLAHAPALLGITSPTTNSYRRLVPGFEAPISLAYSARNRSACVRIPVYHSTPGSKRIEFRPPDPTCNPYLAFPAMLMAGLDGIAEKRDPGQPMDKDLYDLPPEEAAAIEHTPTTLLAVLDALRQDHEFLLKGDVFTQDLIDTWIEYKTENEAYPVMNRPHPYEFHLYYDA
ncbi:MAG: type I glutamate--ammonia ligase [Armatimonadetes bacterium]|nr:type I glutamate--ammonia ligase [Armatimonadota bacterium]